MRSLLVLVVGVALVVVLTVDVARVCGGPATSHARVVPPVAGAHQRWWSAVAGAARVGVADFDDVGSLSSRSHPRTHRRRLDWSALAWCESRGHWRDDTGNGYYGGVQESPRFWASFGGLRVASRPDLATPAEQIAVAARGWRAQGQGAWPNCWPYLVGAR